MTHRIEIPTPPGFSFKTTVESHGWYQLAPFAWDPATQTLTRIEQHQRNAVELQIGWRAGRLIVQSQERLNFSEPSLPDRLRRMFQLDVDLTEFHMLCSLKEGHQKIARARFGRLLCGSTLFEDAVKIICTTNTTWRQTKRMAGLLTDRFGASTPSGSKAFPQPRALAEAGAGQLQRECSLGYRAQYIHQLANGITDGTIDPIKLSDRDLETSESYRQYLQLPGIGPYGAAHLLAMDGRHDFIAVDTEFRRFVRETYHHGRKVADATMLRRYKQWGRWKYLAYWSELWGAPKAVSKEAIKRTQ